MSVGKYFGQRYLQLKKYLLKQGVAVSMSEKDKRRKPYTISCWEV